MFLLPALSYLTTKIIIHVQIKPFKNLSPKKEFQVLRIQPFKDTPSKHFD